MSPFLIGLFLLLNGGGIAAFLRYHAGVKQLCAQIKTNADAQATLTADSESKVAALIAGLESRVNLVHECTLILGQNQKTDADAVQAVRGELAVQSNAIAAQTKQFADLSFGIRTINARVKKEEAAAAVQEAERARIAAHRLAQATPAPPVTAVPPIIPANLVPGAGPAVNPYKSGTLNPNLSFQQDVVNAGSYGPGVPSTRLMPIGAAGNPQVNSAIKSIAETVVNETINNAIATIPPTTPVTDGLIHGETPWETDPAAIVLQDEFISGTNNGIGMIGSLGWTLAQTGASTGFNYTNAGGPFPYYGEFAIGASASGAANSGYLLTLNTTNSNQRVFAWPFVANPPWKMIWVFRFMPNLGFSPTAGFDLTNRAFYIGLGVTIPEAITFAQRPYNFVGLRFDQDTTAPSIGDTTFQFEVLQNGSQSSVSTRTSSNGVNNQGGATFSVTSTSCTSDVITVTAANTLQLNSMVTFSNLTTSTFLNGVTANVVSANSTSFTINYTKANYSATTETGTATLGGSVTNTGITPVIGQYYRFEMSCSTVGQVNMSLSNGTTTFSATNLAVPQYSFNMASGWTFANDFTGEFNLQCGTDGPVIAPFGPGSVLAFSNFTSSAAVYNGSQTVFNNIGTALQLLTATATGPISLVSGTVAGYPSHLIQASFGTTTSGSGTANCAMHIDFFGFAWNPGVNGGTGTPIFNKT